MAVEITSTDGLYQFKVNENNATELLIRRNKLGARWYVLSRQDSAVLSLKALLAAKDRQDGVARVTIEFVPFGIEQLARDEHVLTMPLESLGDFYMDDAVFELTRLGMRPTGESDNAANND